MACSRRAANKTVTSQHSAVGPQLASSAPQQNSTNHVDTSLKTCVESLSAVRRLHKDLANHIEVCLSVCLMKNAGFHVDDTVWRAPPICNTSGQ